MDGMRKTARTLVVGLAASCGANGPHAREPGSVADRCAMIEAAFRLDVFRSFACGTAATKDGRILVDVVPAFPRDASCSSRVFALYRDGGPTNTDAVLRMTIGSRDGQTWDFGAVYFDPPNSPDDRSAGDGFDSANDYCAFGFGRLAWSGDGWRAWDEPPK